jgi:hypothetical protein
MARREVHGSREDDHLARHEICTHTHPLPGAPLSTRCDWQSTEGYDHSSRLISGGAQDNELDGDARRTQGFIQVRAIETA